MALLSAAIAAGCGTGQSTGSAAVDAASASTRDRAATLSVSTFRLSGWHDGTYHYLPALSVTAPPTGRAVLVQRVDFTTDDSGTRRLLKGVRYAASPRVHPGATVALVPQTGAADPVEIASPLALGSVSAIVFFTDDDGQAGIVSAAAGAPEVPVRAPHASLEIRQFTVDRRQHHGRFLYWPKLTLAETSGRSRASIKKILFELLDSGTGGDPLPLWNAPDVAAGETISLVTSRNAQGQPWFEVYSSGDVSRISVAVSFVDDAGRGGLVSAIARVQR